MALVGLTASVVVGELLPDSRHAICANLAEPKPLLLQGASALATSNGYGGGFAFVDGADEIARRHAVAN